MDLVDELSLILQNDGYFTPRLYKDLTECGKKFIAKKQFNPIQFTKAGANYIFQIIKNSRFIKEYGKYVNLKKVNNAVLINVSCIICNYVMREYLHLK